MVGLGYTKVRSLKRSGRRLYTKARECPNPLYGHSGVKPTALAVGYKPAICVNYVKKDLTFR